MNIELYTKSDQTLNFTYYENDGTTVRSLAGATVYFTIKANQYSTNDTDADALVKKDVTSHVNAALGRSDIVLTHTDMDIAPNSNYHYDIKVKESDNKVYPAQWGECSVLGMTTNRA